MTGPRHGLSIRCAGFNEYLKNDLSKRKSDWRLGKERYTHKSTPFLGTQLTPGTVVNGCRRGCERDSPADFPAFPAAAPQRYPAHRDPVDLNLMWAETLAKIGDKHATPQNYFADAPRDLDETREFVRAKNLLPLPSQDNLKVIETPEFHAGRICGRRICSGACARTKTRSLLWITPIRLVGHASASNRSCANTISTSLKLLTSRSHAGAFTCSSSMRMPSSRNRGACCGRSSETGRTSRDGQSIATGSDAGRRLLGRESELRLTSRSSCCACWPTPYLDIRLQTLGMSDDEAMDLMVKPHLPGEGRSNGEVAARQADLLPVADLLRRLA